MRATTYVLLLMTIVIASATSVAYAYAPKVISYQGVLTDDVGTPLDGSYNLTFKIYSYPPVFLDLPTWTETQNGVQFTSGYFAVDLGSVNPIDFTLGGDYVLGITVNGGTELTPRIPLRSVPYAMALKMPYGATVNDAGSAFFVRNNGAGAALEAVGTVKVGSTSMTGQQDFYMQNVATPIVHLGSEGPRGGRVGVFDELGNMLGTLEADIDGAGGEFEVRRGPGQAGFMIDGNWSGTGDPVLTLQGASRSVTMNMNSNGNGSVQLPGDAISASETLDEPGVANVEATATTTMNANTVATLLTRSINVPAAGYVVATGMAELSPNAATSSFLFLSISTQNGVIGDMEFVSDGPVANVTRTGSAQAVIPVSAGTNYFYLIGRTFFSGWDIRHRSLTLMYFPTAYGITSPSPGEEAP